MQKKYTEEELTTAFNSTNFGSPKTVKIMTDLLQRAGKGDEMSLAEKDRVYRFMESSFNPETGEQLNFDDFPSIEDHVFKYLYLEYHEDLEGKYGIHNAWGLIPMSQKKKDVERLNQHFIDWKLIVAKSNHSEELLNHITKDARNELKQLKEIATAKHWDLETVHQKEKSITLHCKYLYLTVKGFFEENDGNPVVAKYNGGEIEITTFSLAHIMFRHYAGIAKQFDTDKSFHLDSSINYRVLPFELKAILEMISLSGHMSNEPVSYIPFALRGTPYAIHTKEAEKSIKGKQVKFTRLQTYYPIEEKSELDQIAKERVSVKINNELSVFKKK